jgi:hypothetical protein
MHRPTDEDPPPRSTDLEGWRRAVTEGRHTSFRPEDIVAAIQDLGPCADKAVLNPLAKHLSDALLRILRARVGLNHPNRGDDIIDRVAGQLFEAVLRPTSADGKALRVAFGPRVAFRIKDALAAEARATRHVSIRDADARAESLGGRGSDTPAERMPTQCDPADAAGQGMDVEAILEQVTDDRKRLAFRLHMDGVPCKSKKSDSIAKALGISEKTAREWVKEVQELLSSVPAVQAIQEARGST